MISLLVYIATPLLAGYIMMIATTIVFYKLSHKNNQIVWSMWLAIGQAAVATISVALTHDYAISRAACEISIFGSLMSLGVAAVDGVSLSIWLINGVRSNGRKWLLWPLVFLTFRLLTHAAFTGSLMWCAALCTV